MTEMAAASSSTMQDMNASSSVDDGDDDMSSFDDVEMAATGINMMLNNGFEEAYTLFEKYRNESSLMQTGFSFVLVMQALLSFEEDKVNKAIKVLQETEKKCSTSEGMVKSIRKKFKKKSKSGSLNAPNVEDKITNQMIVADCILYQALLVFTNQDISSYIKGGWLLRKAWKIYEKLHAEVSGLMDDVNHTKVSQKLASSFSSSVDSSPVKTVETNSTTNSSRTMAETNKLLDSVTSSVTDGNENELTQDVLARLLGGINFGYGVFQLCLSMVPPKILKLIEFLGFEGDREVGLGCLMFTSHSTDMKAPLATLTLLWYHTFLRPFFAVDDALKLQDGTKEAETIMGEKEKDFPNSSLFLFFRGRIHRLRKETKSALPLYQRALEEAQGQREIELMCVYEISSCHLLRLDWAAGRDGFARLLKESRWSRAYYTHLVAVCLGAKGELDAAADLFRKVPGLVKRKNNPIESFVSRRAEKFKKQLPTVEHCRLLTVEMMFLWNILPMATTDELQPLLEVCDMQTDIKLLPLKCMLEGAIYKAMGQEEMALTCLKEALARHQGRKEDMFIPAYTLFEMATIYMRSNETLGEAKSTLTLVKDNYKDYDLENRLSVRVNNALRLLKSGYTSASTSPSKPPPPTSGDGARGSKDSSPA